MKSYLNILGLLVLLFLVSCKQETKNKEFIDRLSSIQNGLPSPYFNYYLYFKMDNNKVIETNIDLIYEMYKDYYSQQYTSLNIFLEKLLIGKEIIKSENINTLKKKGNFLINVSDVDNEINKMSIINIEKSYLKTEPQDTFILKTGKIEPVKVQTILYKMFTNEYIVTFSDYGGYYNIKKYKEEYFK